MRLIPHVVRATDQIIYFMILGGVIEEHLSFLDGRSVDVAQQRRARTAAGGGLRPVLQADQEDSQEK